MNKDTTNVDLAFKGESNNWEAESYISGSFTFIKESNEPVEYESNSLGDFTLSFKGDPHDLASAQDFSYSYEYKSSKMEVVEPKPSKTVFKHKKVGFPIYAIDEDTTIQVTVRWNGKEESFILETQK